MISHLWKIKFLLGRKKLISLKKEAFKRQWELSADGELDWLQSPKGKG